MSGAKGGGVKRESAAVESWRWQRFREWCIAVMQEAQEQEKKKAS